MNQDLPADLIDDIEAFCDPFLTVLDDLDVLVIGNRIFKQRNVDIGVVSLEDCWKWGFSGVMVRGSGAAWDLRKAQPYECYEEMVSTSPWGGTATTTTARSSAWRRCVNRCASCASASPSSGPRTGKAR